MQKTCINLLHELVSNNILYTITISCSLSGKNNCFLLNFNIVYPPQGFDPRSLSAIHRLYYS